MDLYKPFIQMLCFRFCMRRHGIEQVMFNFLDCVDVKESNTQV